MDAQLHEPFAKQPPECDTHTCSPHPLFTGYGERKRMPTGIKGSRKGSRQAWAVPLMLLPRATILARKQPPYAVLRYYRHCGHNIAVRMCCYLRWSPGPVAPHPARIDHRVPYLGIWETPSA